MVNKITKWNGGMLLDEKQIVMIVVLVYDIILLTCSSFLGDQASFIA